MPPSVQDEQSAVDLDYLLMVHAKFSQIREEKRSDG